MLEEIRTENEISAAQSLASGLMSMAEKMRRMSFILDKETEKIRTGDMRDSYASHIGDLQAEILNLCNGGEIRLMTIRAARADAARIAHVILTQKTTKS